MCGGGGGRGDHSHTKRPGMLVILLGVTILGLVRGSTTFGGHDQLLTLPFDVELLLGWL